MRRAPFLIHALEMPLRRRHGGLAVVDGDDLSGQGHLGIHRMDRSALDLGHTRGHFGRLPARHQAEECRHGAIRHAHHFAIHVLRRRVEGNVVALRLAHLEDPVGARQDPHDHADVRQHTEGLHQFAAGGDDVEELIGAADLDVGPQVIGVVRLRQGIERLMQVDGVVVLPAFAKRVAGQELLQREVGGQGDRLLQASAAPARCGCTRCGWRGDRGS